MSNGGYLVVGGDILAGFRHRIRPVARLHRRVDEPPADGRVMGLGGALERRLGAMLGRPVDLLPEPVEKPRLRANIERDRLRAF